MCRILFSRSLALNSNRFKQVCTCIFVCLCICEHTDWQNFHITCTAILPPICILYILYTHLYFVHIVTHLITDYYILKIWLTEQLTYPLSYIEILIYSKFPSFVSDFTVSKGFPLRWKFSCIDYLYKGVNNKTQKITRFNTTIRKNV